METSLRLTITRRARNMPASLAWGAALLVLVLLASCVRASGIPDIERRAQQLNQGIMCPVCPGESIDQSQNPLAVQMRDVVREKLEEGWSEQQVKEFFAERYGPSVLMEPPASGVGIAAWVVPPIAVVGGIVAVMLVMRAMSRGRRPIPEGRAVVDMSDQERERYTKMIEAALEPNGEGTG